MIYELFSHRRKRLAKAGTTDIYQYVDATQRLKVQLQQLFTDAIGPQNSQTSYMLANLAPDNADGWQFIHKTLCREIGAHILAKGLTEREQVLNRLDAADIDEFLDVVELCARYIDLVMGDEQDYHREALGITQAPSEAISELNFRLREAALGYRYENGELLRVDSEYSHEEIIKPALSILSDKSFSGAQEEFLRAHRYYRSGEYSQSITEAAKSFESTLKSVCDIKGWRYDKGSRASDLLKVVRQNALWPSYLDASFDQLLATLTSGLPKVRNEEGAHGQGTKVKAVPGYIAGYALQLAASKIKLIAEAATDKSK